METASVFRSYLIKHRFQLQVPPQKIGAQPGPEDPKLHIGPILAFTVLGDLPPGDPAIYLGLFKCATDRYGVYPNKGT